MNDKITFQNLVTVELEDGTVLSRKFNAQTLDNRNMLIDLYDGTNPTSAINLSLNVFYINADTVGSPNSLAITSSDDETTEPTGSSVEAWGYEKTLRLFSGSDIGDPDRGGLIVRGRIYFPIESSLIRIDMLDSGNSITLFNSEQDELIPAGRSARITYRIGV